MSELAIQEVILRNLYEVHFGSDGQNILPRLRDEERWDEKAFGITVDQMVEDGLIFSQLTGGFYEIRPRGILWAEQEGLVDDKLFLKNEQVRLLTLEVLQKVRNEKGPSADEHYTEISKETGIDNPTLIANLRVLEDLDWVESDNGFSKITRDGIDALEQRRGKRAVEPEFEKISKQQLRQFVLDHYDLEEFRTLCFDLDVRYDDLRGEGLSAKIRELILLIERREQRDRLLEALHRDRIDPFERTGLSTERSGEQPSVEPTPVTSIIEKESEEEQPDLVIKSADVPNEVMTQIRTKAEQDHPDDFSTQRYVINKEIQAWQKLQRLEASDVPQDVLKTIVTRAEHNFPNDFSTQLYSICKEIEVIRQYSRNNDVDCSWNNG